MDEQNCHTVDMRPNYQSQVAPSRDPLTKVEVYFSIIQILGISTMDSTVRLKFNVSLKWFDPRLVFHGIWYEHGAYNVLRPKEFNYVWTPEFNYSNIQQTHLEVHQAPEISVYGLQKNNKWNFTVPDLTSLYNYQVFSGDKVKLHWTHKLR